MVEDFLQELFNPNKESGNISKKIMKGILKLRNSSPKLYLDNSIFSLLIDSTEKKIPISLIKKQLRYSRIIINFKRL